MNRFWKMVALAASLSILAVGLGSLANRPAKAANGDPPVTVINTPTNPVPVKDVDNPARQPIHIHLEADLAAGKTQTACPTALYTVPKAKELVVEYVSMWGVSANLESATIDISRTGVQTEYIFFLEHKGTSQIGHPLYGASQQTRLYFGPGEIVNYCVARDASTDDLGYRIRLSGYLVNLP